MSRRRSHSCHLYARGASLTRPASPTDAYATASIRLSLPASGFEGIGLRLEVNRLLARRIDGLRRAQRTRALSRRTRADVRTK
jgi:hypothetical protein